MNKLYKIICFTGPQLGDEAIDIQGLKLSPQGACDSGPMFLFTGDVIPAGFREVTESEVRETPLYKARKASLNKRRDSQVEAGFTVEGIGTFDTDLTAQMRQGFSLLLSELPILRAMFSAMYKKAEAEGDTETTDALDAARTAFQVPWILADNTNVTLGFDELKVVCPAIAQHVSEQVHGARLLKDQVLQDLMNPVVTAPEADAEPDPESAPEPEAEQPAVQESTPEATE